MLSGVGPYVLHGPANIFLGCLDYVLRRSWTICHHDGRALLDLGSLDRDLSGVTETLQEPYHTAVEGIRSGPNDFVTEGAPRVRNGCVLHGTGSKFWPKQNRNDDGVSLTQNHSRFLFLFLQDLGVHFFVPRSSD